MEGGGLSIQGVSLASNCHVTLCVFGVFFMLAGVVLSYVSYSVTLGVSSSSRSSSNSSNSNSSNSSSSSKE